MKTQLKKLERLVKFGVIDISDFYSVSFSESDIELQGNLSGDKVKKYSKFDLKIEPVNGYIEGIRYNIKIALT